MTGGVSARGTSTRRSGADAWIDREARGRIDRLPPIPTSVRCLPPARVLGGDFNGLAIVEASWQARRPGLRHRRRKVDRRASRYATHAVRVPSLRDDAGVVDALLRIGRRLDAKAGVLYPTRDEIVAPSRNRTILERQFVVFSNTNVGPWVSVARAWDSATRTDARPIVGSPGSGDLGPARCARARSSSRLVSGHDEARDQGALHLPHEGEGLAGGRSGATRGPHSSRRRALVGEGEVMVQEYIPGDGRHQFAFCSFFKQSRSLGTMVVQRRRQHPAEFGPARAPSSRPSTCPSSNRCPWSSFGRSTSTATSELWQRDQRDGVIKLTLDFNARCGGYHAQLGARAGVDFPAFLFDDLAGHSPRERRAGRSADRLVGTTYRPPHGNRAWPAYRPRLPSMLATFDIESVSAATTPFPDCSSSLLSPTWQEQGLVKLEGTID